MVAKFRGKFKEIFGFQFSWRTARREVTRGFRMKAHQSAGPPSLEVKMPPSHQNENRNRDQDCLLDVFGAKHD